MHRIGPVAMALALPAFSACGSNGKEGTNYSGALYTATCDIACDNQVACHPGTDWYGCVVDCATEPWPRNYTQCVASTCEVSEASCETFGVRTCEQACDKMVDCGLTDERDACVADCEAEPWPGNYIDCRATSCDASEAQCEKFTG